MLMEVSYRGGVCFGNSRFQVPSLVLEGLLGDDFLWMLDVKRFLMGFWNGLGHA